MHRFIPILQLPLAGISSYIFTGLSLVGTSYILLGYKLIHCIYALILRYVIVACAILVGLAMLLVRSIEVIGNL